MDSKSITRKLNLACNIKITENDDKYRHINDYIFFQSLVDAVQHNHQILSVDLEHLQDLNWDDNASAILIRRTRVQNSLLNLLNSHKLFIDMIDRNYKKQNPKMYARFRIITSHYYDNDFNYRICEALRNYCQHAGTVPIDIFSDFEGSTYVFINTQALSKDKQIHNKMQQEINSTLHVELNSICREWIFVVEHIYGLTLDYFAYRAKTVVKEYLNQLDIDIISLRADPVIAEKIRNVEVKTIQKKMHFPVLPDSRLLCKKIIDRLASPEHVNRYSCAKKIFKSIQSSKNSSRKLRKIGCELELPMLDTLTLKYVNKFLDGKDPF